MANVGRIIGLCTMCLSFVSAISTAFLQTSNIFWNFGQAVARFVARETCEWRASFGVPYRVLRIVSPSFVGFGGKFALYERNRFEHASYFPA